MDRQALKVGIAGIGAIGSAVAQALDRGEIPGCKLAAISARSAERAAEFDALLSNTVSHVPLQDMAQECDIVLEALPPSMFDKVAAPTLKAGKILVAMSGSQLLGREDLVELGRRSGGRIVIPSGAMLGLDAIKATAVGIIHEVKIVTRKPPSSLVGAPYIVRTGLKLDKLDDAICILQGTVLEIAKEFPSNVNVAAAVSLAGVGPERTKMEIWADPRLQLNTHTLSVRSDSSDFSMSIQNRPSDENPATGRITSQSVIAYLRQLNAVLRIGT
ncbi:aspartate dehydrogenase [Mesorhizobium sp. M1A.F.Ca.IN.020.06.1.1]|uniref:aspartate dehydrogenase n=1 Tax=unclassified Mesorhizobium TaxID=325217 RepID=UPI000FCBE55C|nr:MULTISPECIES: aspartate dehydrogenase [unclassified Mesorhizobium]RUV83718.1 aspartate dehydrogenase [Mesorhizobium sp. M1A.F.Ca.IN.020.32.1.1]RUW05390.1 aspartate dehydrogenase [Mesorhizobium sp. M1A.F.Ca.IN.022.05.2.1]RUW18337.1 aspartate dehydrogenase [Mesorhizobium sp. M1A.F.Ca.IN.020.06.1.1]RWF84981.1 MAG: aspartate dehydrogenase [Mesorhizobium sp.]RWG07034.1 MAG: aspartate dehydrogenase [Mesorhizobium sp.]